jgi:hypothetical protein
LTASTASDRSGPRFRSLGGGRADWPTTDTFLEKVATVATAMDAGGGPEVA